MQILLIGRIFAALMTDFKPMDYMITSDADLFPLLPRHFSVDRNWNKTCHLYNAWGGGQFTSADGQMKDMFPIGYIGMTVKTWRVHCVYIFLAPFCT
jgi:hypothetical protein